MASVYAQTLKPRELIIVDDASAVPVDAAQLPSTPEGVSLVILRNARSQGGAKSLNRAVGEASCPVIAFLDSDDIFLPDYLEMVARAWSEADASIVCVATGFFWCTNDLIPYRRQFAAAPVTHRPLLAGGNIVGGSSVISVRREAFMACGGYPECGGSHDWGLLISLTRNGKLRCLDEPLVLYRSPSTNPKPTYTRSYRKQILAVRTIYLRQPPEGRRIMLPRRKKLLLSHLANMGRRRMALRVALSILRRPARPYPRGSARSAGDRAGAAPVSWAATPVRTAAANCTGGNFWGTGRGGLSMIRPAHERPAKMTRRVKR